MRRAPLHRVRVPPTERFSQPVIRGMRDSHDPPSSSPELARLLLNVYPETPEIGSALTGRPGFREYSVTTGKGQEAVAWTDPNGITRTAVIIGGKLFRLNWSQLGAAGGFTQITLPSPILISANAQVYTTVMRGFLIVSDGVHKPWRWDGTNPPEQLSNAPVFYGAPVVYYAKLFGIKNADRRTLVWSEEMQPNTGYEAGGYNNAWDLIQVRSDPLTGLAATNEALYYFRESSISTIHGPIDSQFQTAGTAESVSSTVGTLSPGSVLVKNRNIFFLDQALRPQMIQQGAGLVQPAIGTNITETANKWTKTRQEEYRVSYSSTFNMVFFSAGTTFQADLDDVVCFDGDTGAVLSIWRGFTFSRFTALTRASEEQDTVVHLDSEGRIYIWGSPDGDVWTDQIDSQIEPILHVVEGGALAYDHSDQKFFDRVDLGFRVRSNLSDVRVVLVTPEKEQAVAGTNLSGSTTQWDFFRWDEGAWAAEITTEEKMSVGFASRGRWARVRVLHDTLGERFGLIGFTLEAKLLGPDAWSK